MAPRRESQWSDAEMNRLMELLRLDPPITNGGLIVDELVRAGGPRRSAGALQAAIYMVRRLGLASPARATMDAVALLRKHEAVDRRAARAHALSELGVADDGWLTLSALLARGFMKSAIVRLARANDVATRPVSGRHGLGRGVKMLYRLEDVERECRPRTARVPAPTIDDVRHIAVARLPADQAAEPSPPAIADRSRANRVLVAAQLGDIALAFSKLATMFDEVTKLLGGRR